MTHNTPNPNHNPRTLYPVIACLAALFAGITAYGQEDVAETPQPIRWRATDTADKDVSVPAPGKISIVLFVMADQARSDEAMTQLRAILTDEATGADVQPIAVVSGHGAGVGAAQLTGSEKWPWPVVVDPDYEASGLMSVRVWPSTVIVNDQGERIARLPGLRESYTKDMRAYLEFTRGTIDSEALKKRLDTNGTVGSTPNHVASRHLHLAQRLLEKGQIKLAHEELKRGLDTNPDDLELRLTLAQVHLMIGEPAEALVVLDALEPGLVPPWRIQTLRGRALVALERFDEARTALTEALKINPDPADAFYFLGRVHQQAGEYEQASNAYRNAFEKSTAAEGLGPAETADGP